MGSIVNPKFGGFSIKKCFLEIYQTTIGKALITNFNLSKSP